MAETGESEKRLVRFGDRSLFGVGNAVCLIICCRLFPASAASHHGDGKQTAGQRAVEQRGAAFDRQVDQVGQAQIAGKEVGSPAGKVGLQPVTQLRVQLGQGVLLVHAHAIRRVGDNEAAIGKRACLQHVLCLQLDGIGQTGALQVGTGYRQHVAGAVAALDRQIAHRQFCRARFAQQCFPGQGVKFAQALETKAAVAARRAFECDVGRFHQEGAAAAHRVQQGLLPS